MNRLWLMRGFVAAAASASLVISGVFLLFGNGAVAHALFTSCFALAGASFCMVDVREDAWKSDLQIALYLFLVAFVVGVAI